MCNGDDKETQDIDGITTYPLGSNNLQIKHFEVNKISSLLNN